MIRERWAKIEELFHRAMECDPARRSRLLDEAGSSDPELRREVELLISCQPSAEGHLRAAIQTAEPLDRRAEFNGTNRFEVQRRLGAGGFGVVYQVYDRQQDAVVALKLLPDPAAGALYDFKREFRGLANTVHRNLVMLYELLSDDEQWFFTMEFVDGVDFIHYVREDSSGPPSQPHFRSTDSTISLSPQHDAPIATPDHGQMTGAAAAFGSRALLLDVDRLRAAVKQLAEGVCALHQAGKLHRDLKPSNVLVTREGRVVILDFGLTTDIVVDALTENAPIIGTPAYMSPEQAAGKPLSEASDWYSVGVMLHQALTGRIPILVRPRDMLSRKQDNDIPPPSTLVAGLPSDLNLLCRDLLRRDPSARPSGREVIERLGGTEKVAVARGLASATVKPSFIGRKGELDELRRAFEIVKAGQVAVVYVHGRSGIGKSALIGHFLKELKTRGAALVLAGRCYEQESVPYKAIDSVVDALAEHLNALPRSQLEALIPENFAALTRLFPVLEGVESFAAADKRTGNAPDLFELRRQALGAFRELLARLALHGPMILFIDDIQWGDVDSAALLGGFLRTPDPPPVMWIMCYRGDEAEASPVLQTLRLSEFALGAPIHLTDLPLNELTVPDARDLARRLLGDDTDAARAETIVRESRGNPFFLYELVRARSEEVGAATSLDNLIRSRILQLPDAARHFLELVAVAGQPISLDVVSQAAIIHGKEQAVLAVLRAGSLIRTRTAGGRNEVENYHDRTREAVAEGLSPQLLRDHHEALAFALEASGRADPEMLLTHFQGAGNSGKARVYAVTAADRAFAALAFERAAGLYRLALELGPGEAAQVQSLRERLGDALTNAGRGGEAAQAYLSATEGSTGLEKLELQRRAAAQLLMSGRIDEGLAVARGVLEAVGVKLSRTLHRSLLRYLFWRARIRLRGLSFHERDASAVPAEVRIRIDTCFSLSAGLSMVDTFWSHEFHARNLLYSLQAGDVYRISRALAQETSAYALPGGRSRRHAMEILGMATSLAAKSGDPYVIAAMKLEAGVCAFGGGQWSTCQQRMETAAAELRKSCTGVAWEIALSHMMGLVSLFFLGELKLLNERLPALLQEAEVRGDLFQGTDLRSRLAHLVHLAADEPDKAYREIETALARWPREHYHLQHWWALIACMEVDFYSGNGHAAWAHIAKQWKPLRRSLLMRIQYVRILSLDHRARAALAAAADRDCLISERKRLLKTAERHATAIQREKMPWGSSLALLLRAGVAAARTNAEEAIPLFCAAEQSLKSADMMLYAAAAKHRRGELTRSDEGRTLIATAEAEMRAQQILNPARMIDMLAPRV